MIPAAQRIALSLTALAVLSADAPRGPSALPGFCLFARGTAIGSSRAGASAKARLDHMELSITSGAEHDRQALAAEDNALATARGQLDPLEFARRVEALHVRLRTQTQMTQAFVQQLARARASALARIDAALDTVLDTVRTQRGCVVIMERNNAYVYANSVDITGDVIRGLDQVLAPFDVIMSPP